MLVTLTGLFLFAVYGKTEATKFIKFCTKLADISKSNIGRLYDVIANKV